MSRFLFIDSRSGGDFSLDLLFAGLIQIYGPHSVVDFPAHEKHRRGQPKLIGDHERDYGAERSSLCYTPKNPVVPSLREDEVREMVRNELFDAVFLDERDESYELWLRLGLQYFGIPAVIVAGHDRFWNDLGPTGVAFRFGRSFRKMFVDDWQPEYDDLPFVKLTNLSANYDHLWDHGSRAKLLADKKYDVCFYGYNSTPSRARFIDHVANRWANRSNVLMLERRPDQFDAFVRHQEYFSVMAQSRVCLNIRGASVGGRALRYYEIPYVGSFMASQRFPARLLHPFEDRVHCRYFSDERELDEVIDWALANPGPREFVASAGHQHLLRFHTSRARAEYVLQESGLR